MDVLISREGRMPGAMALCSEAQDVRELPCQETNMTHPLLGKPIRDGYTMELRLKFGIAMIDFEPYTLGESSEHIEIETSDDNRRAALAMAKQAERSIHLLSYDLDSVVYNDADFVDSLKTLAVRDRHSYIKILIKNTEKIINHGHRLIELSRQLSSFVQIRKLGDVSKPINHAWLIADETALLYLSVANRYEGHVNFNTRRECRQLLTQFHEAWEQSAPDPELQQLHI